MSLSVPTSGQCSNDAASPPYRTAAERVYRIPGLLENIVSFLHRQRDYLNLALASKEGFAIPASEFYRSTRREILVKSFQRGCDPDRFAIYAKGVRELSLPSANFSCSKLLGQHPRLREISIYWCTYIGQETAQNSQLYSSGHQSVEVHGLSLKGHLQHDQRWFVEGPYQIDDDAQIKWNGCLSLHTDQLPQREAVRTIDEILGHLASTVGNAVSPWSILRDLHSPTVTISLGKLESLLRGCPGLATLSCVLSRSGETATYMETLSELLRGPGANLTKLVCKAKGADLCMFARHLAICPLLSVTGTLDWNPHRGVAVPSPIDGAKVVHLFLSIQMPRGWLDSVPGPLDVARYLRRSVLPGSQITIIDSLSEYGGDHQKLWKTTLRMTLETLEDDDKRGKAQAEDAAQPV
ncbi:hypothetical protein HD553DRAFT_337094 [Filobasidium floriforme]|uniref:uncharacterized protein n=1 Tax=Filobasidium floriforme TaxID=5210 RepID=UPI001E8E7A2E|nr:uncharacterized protein HD553DRAFT_337094 [Filobasidium floriforme]KAH8079925.1 hypothetical protein HD553DRAFT_337094 [Filobasidium floriforme]